jgi:hypothetical protein
MHTPFRRLRSTMKKPSRHAVTLVIYGWHESEPGTLAWVFPSLRAALRAVRAMRNAIAWLIVEGRRGFDGDIDLDALRRAGAVLVESAA